MFALLLAALPTVNVNRFSNEDINHFSTASGSHRLRTKHTTTTTTLGTLFWDMHLESELATRVKFSPLVNNLKTYIFSNVTGVKHFLICKP